MSTDGSACHLSDWWWGGGGDCEGWEVGGVGVRASVHEGEEAPGRKGDGGARAH